MFCVVTCILTLLLVNVSPSGESQISQEDIESVSFSVRQLLDEVIQLLQNEPNIEVLQSVSSRVQTARNAVQSLNPLEFSTIQQAIDSMNYAIEAIEFEIMCQLGEDIVHYNDSPELHASNDENSQISIFKDLGGRPEINIDIETLAEMTQEGYSAKQIADSFSCSEMTIRTKAKQYLGVTKFSKFNKNQASEQISQVKKEFPNFGIRMTQAAVQEQYGVCLPHNFVIQELHQQDPVGMATRWARTIRRRRYSVEGPNFLWHMDANHKVIFNFL